MKVIKDISGLAPYACHSNLSIGRLYKDDVSVGSFRISKG